MFGNECKLLQKPNMKGYKPNPGDSNEMQSVEGLAGANDCMH